MLIGRKEANAARLRGVATKATAGYNEGMKGGQHDSAS